MTAVAVVLSSSIVAAGIAVQQWCSVTAAMHAQVMHTYCSGAAAAVVGGAVVAVLLVQCMQWSSGSSAPLTGTSSTRASFAVVQGALSFKDPRD